MTGAIPWLKIKVTTINGVCNSIKVGGNGNDTLLSSGNCNDELTGGLGADKFTCGEGNDTIKDYNPKEGDVILDRQNCEKYYKDICWLTDHFTHQGSVLIMPSSSH